ncbi:MAG: carbohydrate ABC transporter permease [Anaerolineales bacterium]|nr:carbohydrate ABC transporter permease [Anaerolineales bacterium]
MKVPLGKNRVVSEYLLYAVVILVVVVLFDLPMFTTILTAFKTDADISSSPPKWIIEPVLTHFQNVFQGVGFRFERYLLNSVIIGLSATALAILITFPAAYAIVRYKGYGQILMGATLLIRMLPAISYAIPVFVLFHHFKLIDTRLSIIFMHTLFIAPTSLMLLIGYIQDMPRDLEDAAAVDGANVLQILGHVLIPIVRPGLAAVAILGFITSWNEFLFAVILSVEKAVTATVGTSFFITSHQVRWGDMAAAITLSTIPTLIFIFVVQRQLIKGMTTGAIK